MYDTRDTPLHGDIIVPVVLQEAEIRLFLYLQEQCYSKELACLRQGRHIYNPSVKHYTVNAVSRTSRSLASRWVIDSVFLRSRNTQ